MSETFSLYSWMSPRTKQRLYSHAKLQHVNECNVKLTHIFIGIKIFGSWWWNNLMAGHGLWKALDFEKKRERLFSSIFRSTTSATYSSTGNVFGTLIWRHCAKYGGLQDREKNKLKSLTEKKKILSFVFIVCHSLLELTRYQQWQRWTRVWVKQEHCRAKIH